MAAYLSKLIRYGGFLVDDVTPVTKRCINFFAEHNVVSHLSFIARTIILSVRNL